VLSSHFEFAAEARAQKSLASATSSSSKRRKSSFDPRKKTRTVQNLVAMVLQHYILLLSLVVPSFCVVDVFAPGEGGVPQFRIPALVRTDRGTLVAFAEARMDPSTDCAFKWIVAKRSVDNGSTWGPLISVVGHEWGRWATGNVQPFFHAPSHKIVAIVGSKDLSAPGRLCEPGTAVFALDDGGTDGLFWGPPRNLSGALAPAPGGPTLVPGPGTGLVLTKSKPGRLLAVGVTGEYASEVVFWSDDIGVTWDVAPVEVGPGVDEANLAELDNGLVYLSMRSDRKNLQAYSLSSDGGETWGAISFDPTLISPICEGSTATYGGALYFANPADSVHRANITVRRTAPGAPPTQWVSSHVVAPGLTWGGYTSMAKDPVSDGEGGLLFERNITSLPEGCVISFSTFPLGF
jgi:sialidase-1